MVKKTSNVRDVRNIRVKMDVWKKLTRIKTDEDYESLSTLIEEMLKERNKNK